MREPLISWSGGKDCAMALYKTMNKEGQRPSLFTSFNQSTQRVTMHGVPLALIQKQAEELSLPLETLELPQEVAHESYNQLMYDRLVGLKEQGYAEVIFGDIFLEDLKDYRIGQLEKVGLTYRFPIWGSETSKLISEFIELGFKAIVVSVNGDVLSKDFAGVTIDSYFVQQLPKNVDPCGENGEFHTFVYDGPIFDHPIPVNVGEVVCKTYPNPSNVGTVDYWFCDLIATDRPSEFPI